ncbi:MAG TPA: adenylate/guanylate cyclase domain-containing protein [Oligoflexus sp.]|uniref:adenylate/guanylate cyclase domain-containing protein n=1 Tax=Oligoflexus sp. TaxID=1971216 RepID=UPI002D30AFFE|nr:adenylate/guanylate cyclase domain-containing protein [Oligoflexus sp.]HYX31609.1 adenylate/guanylate cyclase domain-containing protein [Oligoflexus sp.]
MRQRTKVEADSAQDYRWRAIDCFLRMDAAVERCSLKDVEIILAGLERFDFKPEIFYLKDTRVKLHIRAGNFDQVWPEIEAQVQSAIAMDNDDFLLRVYLLYGQVLQQVNRSTDALSYFAKAKTVLERNRVAEPFDRHIALVEFAMSTPELRLGSQGPREIFYNAIRYFEKNKLRRYQMIARYNLGALLLDESNPAVRDEAKSHFEKVEALALELEDTATFGPATLALATIDYRNTQYDKAETKIMKAIPIFEKTNPMWLLHAYAQLAEIRQAHGKVEEALQAIEKAESYAGKDVDVYVEDIRLKKLNLLESMGRYEPAYKLLKQLHDHKMKIMEEKAKGEFNKLKVDMGLVVEEEKARILSLENQQEKQTSFYKSIVLVSALVLIVVLVVGLMGLKRQRDKIHSLQQHIHETVLQRFFPPQIIQQVVAGNTPFDQPAQESVITVLFCDLVDFTHSSERLGAPKIALVLNEFFKEVTEEIFAAGGTIDKFIGDAVMVLFGVPLAEDPATQAKKAFQCALAILSCVERLNQHWKQDLGIEFAIRVGMHQGTAIVGSFGSQKRSDYTAIGLNVNIAARIEAKARPNTITLSAEMAQYLMHVPLVPLGPTALRGVSQMLDLYEYQAPAATQSRNEHAA